MISRDINNPSLFLRIIFDLVDQIPKSVKTLILIATLICFSELCQLAYGMNKNILVQN